MKWYTIGLVVVGIVAALCVGVLVMAAQAGAFGKKTVAQAPQPVDLVVAAKDLRAMSMIDASCVTTRKVERSDLPPDALSSPSQVIGKVASLQMLEGQPFTKKCLTNDSAGLSVAAVIPQGKRAVSLSLPDHAALQGLLYPGSQVDVVVSLRLPRQEGQSEQEAVSTAMLENIQVLEVGGLSIMSGSVQPEASASVSSSQKLKVTLLVDVAQAEILQLAAEHGTVNLAMRNPLDSTSNPLHLTLLSQLAMGVAQKARETAGKMAQPAGTSLFGKAAKAANPPSEGKAPAPTERPQAPLWVMTILRGGATETASFPMPVELVTPSGRN